MIIHNPKISGSLQFPSDSDGNLITLQVSNGTLETKTLNSSGVDQNIQPAVNYSGSFTGSFVGDGSSLTGVSAINIDALGALGGATIAQGDNLVISDDGTEKKVTFSNLEDSLFGNVSGDATIAAGGVVTIDSSFLNASLNAATSSYLTAIDISDDSNLAVSDTTQVNMILTDDTISAELIGGVVSGSSQVDADSITNFDSNVKAKLDAETVISGSSQVSISSSQISDVAAFSQSGTYPSLRAQGTTKGDVGLGNVDNTSDAGKPVSTAGQTALDLKANLASPSLSGNPTAPTQADNDNSTKIATTAYVQREVSDLLGGAPAAFDTLLEISASIANGDSDVVALTTTVGTKLAKSTNLSDLADAGTARTNLGVDAAGTDNSTDVTLAGNDYLTISGQEITAGTINNDDLANDGITIGGIDTSLGGTITSEQIRTSIGTLVSGSDQIASTFAQTILDDGDAGTVRTTIGLGSVDNTSDAGKPVSTAGQTALDLKANLASPTLTGTPLAPTATANTNTTQIATTAYVQTELTDLIGGAPGTLDTLNELAAAINDDDDYSSTLTTALALKAPKASPTFTGTIAIPNVANLETAVVANTAKNTNVSTNLSISGTTGARTIASSDGTDAIIPIATTSVSGLLSPGLFDEIDANTAKISYNSTASTKLGTIETSATADQTAAEIRTLVGTGNSNFVPSAGTAGHFLKHDGTFGLPSYTTNTDTNTQLSQEQVEDFVGGMLGGTETGITVTYQDTTGDIDFVVASQTENDFTTVLKNKLDGIEASADVNVVDSVAGKTGTVTLVKGDVGLGNVDNTTDALKPVSTAGQTALDLKANLASPTFTGTPISTTPADNDDSTKIATTAFVMREVSDLIGGAPGTLNTLNELAAAINDDDDYASTLTTALALKAPKASPTFTGTIAIPNVANLETAVVANTAKNTNVVQTTVSGNAGTVTNGVYTTGTQTIGGAKSFSSAVNIDSTTASTTKTTGALIVDGGVGIAGALNVGGDVVAYASSDERLKDNIELISNPIEKVQSLKGVTWDWNSNADELQQSLPNVGVIAQDVEKVLPQLVIDRDNGFKGVDYAKLTGLLIEAVKDQQKQIDELKSKIS